MCAWPIHMNSKCDIVKRGSQIPKSLLILTSVCPLNVTTREAGPIFPDRTNKLTVGESMCIRVCTCANRTTLRDAVGYRYDATRRITGRCPDGSNLYIELSQLALSRKQAILSYNLETKPRIQSNEHLSIHNNFVVCNTPSEQPKRSSPRRAEPGAGGRDALASGAPPAPGAAEGELLHGGLVLFNYSLCVVLFLLIVWFKRRTYVASYSFICFSFVAALFSRVPSSRAAPSASSTSGEKQILRTNLKQTISDQSNHTIYTFSRAGI